MQAADPMRPLCECGAGAGRHRDHDDVSEAVERHRDQAKRDELHREMTRGWVDELRNEGKEERRGLGIERLDHDAVAKRATRRWS